MGFNLENMKKIIFILVIGLTNACDTLDQIPVSIIAESNFYRNGADAESAVLGIYDRFQGHVTDINGYIGPAILKTDEADAVRGGNFNSYEQFTETSNTNPVITNWNELYATIARANDVLENVPNITDPNLSEGARNRVLGEAYFFRGFCHYLLTRRYGKIPIVTESFQSLEQDYQPNRDEVAQVYEQIISDLSEAKNLLPGNVDNKARVSRWTAAGILAKVYLQRNTDGDKDNALDELTEITNSQEYSLVPAASYSDLFAAGAQNTVETIWELSYRPEGIEDANMDNEFVVSQNFRIEPSIRIINAFKADSALVVGSGKDEVRMAAALERHYPLIVDGTCRAACDSRNKYFINKYTKDDWKVLEGRAQLHPNVIILRLADVMLLRAELLNEMGNTSEAKAILNEIRDRVNLPPTTAVGQDDVRLAVENERFLELAFEAHRYWDLLRTNRLIEVLQEEGRIGGSVSGTSLPNPNRFIWPLPQAEMDQNPNILPQNPGY